MKVWMYEFEERRKGESEVSKLRILQLAGKVDLGSKANISGVCWPICPKSSEKKISMGKVMSGYAVLKSQANRSRTVQKNGSFLVNRRSYWAEIPADRSQPLLKRAEFFSRSISISDCWVSGKSVFWLFLRQKIEKVPIFWARSNCTSESYFVLNFQKHRTIFGHFLLLGTFGARRWVFSKSCFWAWIVHNHWWMDVCISVLVDSCPFSFFFVISFFNCHQLFQL